MPLVCPRCQRANPAEAGFCHFDGAVLLPTTGGSLPAGTLPLEFVFPSGRRCKTFDDLVQGCQYEWEDARVLLKRGEFGPYFARIGRLDLARIAREAQAQPDTDIALHEMVAELPATCVQGPRLDLQPRRLLIGPVPAGAEDEIRLTVVNQGKGLLQGKLAVSDGGGWLRAGDNGNVALKTARAQEVVLRVCTRGLAAPHSYSARLTVVSNGGIVEVPVRLDVATIPFGRPPLQGAMTPRDLAARMRANPKAAVPLLESGAIADWFAANGWVYPVAGAPARGVASVQQFFEYMGLSKPPPLSLLEPTRHFDCEADDVASGQLTIRTDARKWVYAEVTSDAAWLRVTTPQVSGPQQAVATFEVDADLVPDDESNQARLTVVGNAGQTLNAIVTASVHGPQKKRSLVRRQVSPVLVGALAALFCRLLLAVPADLIARSGPGGLEYWVRPALSEAGFLRTFVLTTWWLGALAAVLVARRAGGKWSDLVCGSVCGGFAGLIGAATCGCLVSLLDAGPRAVLARLAVPGVSATGAALLWVALAASCWAVGGAVLGGALRLCGSPGRAALAALAMPAAWLRRGAVLRQ